MMDNFGKPTKSIKQMFCIEYSFLKKDTMLIFGIVSF
jgi:hypothetical protein